MQHAAKRFHRCIADAERLVANVEILWQTAPKGTQVRRNLGPRELQSLYELAYLSIFGDWEVFLEDSLSRMLAGRGTASWSVALVQGRPARSIRRARLQLLGTRQYLLWHDVDRVIRRVRAHVSASPLEHVLSANRLQLQFFAQVRHAIAHRSDHATTQFKAGALSRCGLAYASPGEFLRSQDHTDPLNPVRRLRSISNELAGIAQQAAS